MFQVGKMYVTRDGNSLLRIKRDDKDRKPFPVELVAGHHFHTGYYTRDGEWLESGRESPHDMVSEWTRPVSEFEPRDPGNSSLSSMHEQIMQSLSSRISLPSQIVQMGQQSAPPPPAVPPVTWGDVIGLEEAKASLQEAIEAPYLHADVYKHFGMAKPKGVLLYGPPGCGKTMLGKAAAGAMAKVHNKPYRDGFFYFNGAEMMGPTVGYEGRWVRECFEKAEKHFRAHGYPAVLFFDEVDSMLRTRQGAPPWIVEGVNTFLSKLDGLDPCSAFVILATNNHHVLDEAAIRAGRIDKRIYVGRPEKKAVQAILTSAFLGKPVAKGADALGMVEYICGQLFSESRIVDGVELKEILNGAMVVSVVEIAASFAFRRALSKSKEDGFAVAAYGIGPEDVRQAVDHVHREQIEMKANAPKGIGDLVQAGIDTMKKIAESDDMDGMK